MKNKRQAILMNKEKLNLLCLVFICLTEVLYMLYKPIGSIIHEILVPMICAFFLGLNILDKRSLFNRKYIVIGLLFIFWFYFTSIFHYLGGEDLSSPGRFMIAYAIALPFAFVTNDKKDVGLKIAGIFYLFYSLLLTILSIMMVTNTLPSFFNNVIYFDGYRLYANHHPNRTGMIMMIGILFSFYYFSNSKKAISKSLFIISIAAQYFVMILTNSRTAILLCCLIFGVIYFYYSLKNNSNEISIHECIKSAIFGLIITLISFIVYIYINKYQMYILGSNSVIGSQGTLINDLATGNNRTMLWSGALKALFDNPKILLIGTDDLFSYMEMSIGVNSHPHSSWFHTTFNLGIVGLTFAIYFGFLLLKNSFKILYKEARTSKLSKKVINLLCLVLFAASMVEPYLFTGYYHYFNFIYFLCVGCLAYD